MRKRIAGAAAAAAVLAWAGTASAQSYTFKTADYSKTLNSVPQAVSPGNTIVGNYYGADGVRHCYTQTGNTKSTLNDPNGVSTECYDINASGEIVGTFVDSNGINQGYSYSGGTFTTVAPPGAVNGTIVYGLSDKGVLIGTWTDAAQAQHGFIKSGAKYTSFDLPNEAYTLGIDVNNSGVYTVQGVDAQLNYSGYVYIGKKLRQVVYPGSTVTVVHKINNQGQVALGWFDTAGVEHGGVYDTVANAYYAIDPPGAAGSGTEGINDAQTLVGFYATPTGTVLQGYLATGSLP